MTRNLDQQSTTPEETPSEIQAFNIARIHAVLNGRLDKVELPPEIASIISQAEVAALETQGVTFHGSNEQHPDGGLYVKDHFQGSVFAGKSEDTSHKVDKITATGLLKGIAPLVTKAPTPELPEEFKGLQKMPVNSLSVAVFDGEKGEWTDPQLLPDGDFLVGSLDNAAFQYGQAAFEGLVAVIDDEGEATVFRPEKNAERFIGSCERLQIPAPSVEQFIAAITQAVSANKKYIPKGGKLYIRPYAVGLQGGAGANAATNYLFAIDTTPFGTYLAAKDAELSPETMPGINVKAITYDRPEFSKHKLSGSYAPTFKPKAIAKKQGFNDVLLINSEGEIQESASSNTFHLVRTGDNKFVITTPGTDQNILPGITRKSLLTVLQDPKILEQLGVQVEVKAAPDQRLHEDDLKAADGLFSTGTAAGITNIGELTTRSGDRIYLAEPQTQRLIKKLADLLVRLRRGQVEGYEDWALKIN